MTVGMDPSSEQGLEQVLDLPQQRDLQYLSTHGYIHGHVHRHNDHMHIHGHIHNHDHQGHAHELSEPCSHFDEVCNEIFCDDLDDCYYESCGNSKVSECADCFPGESGNQCCDEEDCGKQSDVECCEDPYCLHDVEAICNDPGCLDHLEATDHENNLCDYQAQRMSIFKNILESVQRGVEKPQAKELASPNVNDSGTSKKKRRIEPLEDEKFQIHFPHRCHAVAQAPQDSNITSDKVLRRSETPILPSNGNSPVNNHHTHQSCFHARIPNSQHDFSSSLAPQSEKQQSDFDFFIQFNNFNLIFDSDETKVQQQHELSAPLIGNESPSAPSSYSCKWENCFKKVDDHTLLDHLIDEHINTEYHLDNRDKLNNQAFQCEWDNCSFSNQNLNSFISHLNSHKGFVDPKNRCLADFGQQGIPLAPSPLLTPNSASSSTGSPQQTKKEDGNTVQNPINITSMEILPKPETKSEPLDKQFTCRWQVGTTPDGEPMICGKTHSSEGDLQHHLQQDHIGLGKSQYNCCWVGCERCGGKPFVQRQKLYRHIHIHTNYKPCKCEICGGSFAVPATLRQHMRTHSGERPFTCTFCGKKFTTSSSLSIHNRVHSGARPLECKWPGCGKRFSESSNLAKHMRVHTKSYKCEECGEVFALKKDFTKHKKTHNRPPNHDTLIRNDVIPEIKRGISGENQIGV